MFNAEIFKSAKIAASDCTMTEGFLFNYCSNELACYSSKNEVSPKNKQLVITLFQMLTYPFWLDWSIVVVIVAVQVGHNFIIAFYDILISNLHSLAL